MNDSERTRTAYGFTDTAAGRIPHLELMGDFGLIHAPVMVWPRFRGQRSCLLEPRVTTEGRYLHALPGGGTIVGERTK